MRYGIGLIVLFFASILFVGMFFSRIEPGEVGVVVDLFGSQKGVEEKELTVGYNFLPPWKSLYKFPIFEQNHEWKGGDRFVFQTSEGLSVSIEVGITYHLEQSRIHELFARYRKGLDEITHLFIKNHIRNAVNTAASKMKIEELYGPKKEEFFDDVLATVREDLDPLGFKISKIFVIGQIDVPENVRVALNEKITAIQRAQQRENELREAEAEARKVFAKAEGEAKGKLLKANAEAQANKVLSESITPELIEWYSVEKWDGKLPATYCSGDKGVGISLMRGN